ncbi:MAG: helix-turn-helix domain-containing protein [Bacteroidota bacterium]
MFRFEKQKFDLQIQPYFLAYWEYERYEPIPILEPLPAVGVMHLEFHAGNTIRGIIDNKFKQSSKITFAGMLPSSGNFIQPHGYYMTYGITISPLGMWRLFGVRSTDCLNGFADYDDVCSEPLPDLLSTPLGKEGSIIRFNLINDWCLKLLRQKNDALSKIEKFTTAITQSQGSAKILSLVEDGSMRQMQRNFKELTGISPKHYASLLRFNTAMALITANPNSSLIEVALRAGYYDTSHLCHDFKKLGLNLPTEWAKSPNDHTASLLESLH